MKKQIIYLTMILLLMSIFTGCKQQDPELTAYNDQLTTFYDNISGLDEELNAIDFTADGSTEDFLNIMDEMKTYFYDFSISSVPTHYSSAQGLAEDAYTYMEDSVEKYHELLEAETYDSELEDEAYLSYTRAMNRISYISDILEGNDIELKDGDTFSTTTEE